jgi:hypothetical protein
MKYPDGDFNQMLQNLQQQQQKLNKTSKTQNYNSCVRMRNEHKKKKKKKEPSKVFSLTSEIQIVKTGIPE